MAAVGVDWAYEPLITQRVETRSRTEQVPATEAGRQVIDAICNYFQGEPQRFEACAWISGAACASDRWGRPDAAIP
jgi:hypothetical protein